MLKLVKVLSVREIRDARAAWMLEMLKTFAMSEMHAMPAPQDEEAIIFVTKKRESDFDKGYDLMQNYDFETGPAWPWACARRRAPARGPCPGSTTPRRRN